MQQACSSCGYRQTDWTSVLLGVAVVVVYATLMIGLGSPRSNLGYRLVVVAGFALSGMGIGWRRERNRLIHKLHSPVGTPSQ